MQRQIEHGFAAIGNIGSVAELLSLMPISSEHCMYSAGIRIEIYDCVPVKVF
jgi:hypothetical protein